MQGWVSLHRKLTNWEWYTDANTMRLFVHCLLKANHANKTWRGIDIERGQFLTSIDSLSKDLRLSVQKIRTSISKLKSTGEITIKTTSKYSIISIACYDFYQTDNKQDDKQTTNKQQTNNKQITTTNNDNNVNNDNNINNTQADAVIDYLNATAKTNFQHAETSRKIIRARLKKYKQSELFLVIDKKSTQWMGSDMEKYLRPSTLFNETKFENYLNEKVSYENRPMQNAITASSTSNRTRERTVSQGLTDTSWAN